MSLFAPEDLAWLSELSASVMADRATVHAQAQKLAATLAGLMLPGMHLHAAKRPGKPSFSSFDHFSVEPCRVSYKTATGVKQMDTVFMNHGGVVDLRLNAERGGDVKTDKDRNWRPHHQLAWTDIENEQLLLRAGDQLLESLTKQLADEADKSAEAVAAAAPAMTKLEWLAAERGVRVEAPRTVRLPRLRGRRAA